MRNALIHIKDPYKISASLFCVSARRFHQPTRKFSMKRALIVLASVLTVAAPAMADEALAKSKNCLACHAVDKKIVGPAYKEVAKKHRHDCIQGGRPGLTNNPLKWWLWRVRCSPHAREPTSVQGRSHQLAT